MARARRRCSMSYPVWPRPIRDASCSQGRDITRMPAHARTRLGMARTFQNLALFSDMSVIDNVRVGAHVRLKSRLLQPACACGAKGPRKRDRCAIPRACWTSSDSLPYAEQPAHGLAFGHQRLLEVARALASRRGFMLLDEPAAGLNSAELEFARASHSAHSRDICALRPADRSHHAAGDGVIGPHHRARSRRAAGRGTRRARSNRDPRVIAAYLGAEDAA